MLLLACSTLKGDSGILVALAQDEDGDGVKEYTPDPNDADCNDADPDVYPGAEEVCDGVDNDCDGQADEAGVCCDSGADSGT